MMGTGLRRPISPTVLRLAAQVVADVQGDPMLEGACSLAPEVTPDGLKVTALQASWPDGKKQRFALMQIDGHYVVGFAGTVRL